MTITKTELETLINQWMEIYNGLDKRTVEAKRAKHNAIKLWNLTNCF